MLLHPETYCVRVPRLASAHHHHHHHGHGCDDMVTRLDDDDDEAGKAGGGDLHLLGAAAAPPKPDPVLPSLDDAAMESPPSTPADPLGSYQLHFPSAASGLVKEHRASPSASHLRMLPGLHLPVELCEKLFSILQEEGLDVEDALAEVFSDTDAARLR